MEVSFRSAGKVGLKGPSTLLMGERTIGEAAGDCLGMLHMDLGDCNIAEGEVKEPLPTVGLSVFTRTCIIHTLLAATMPSTHIMLNLHF